MPGERDRLLADALHQAAIAGDDIGAVIDEVIAEAGASSRSASAMPTALASPWPSGPVVVSIPGAWPYSGWPAVRLPSWRKRLSSSRRHAGIARQMQQRIEQHRAMAGREHEAVAIGPVADRAGSNLRKRLHSTVGDIGHAHGHAGMAALRLLHRIHGEHPDGVGHAPQHRVARGRQGRGWRGRGGLG